MLATATPMEGATVDVLHVDDEPGFGEMVAEFLEKEDDDIEVKTETRAEDALERLEDEEEIDCVVSDYDMPGMNGLELLEEVRDSHPDLPFILFTGKGSEEVASDAISAGVTDYLQKEPGTEQYTVLANRIENSVSMRKSEQELRKTTKRLRAVLNTVSASVFMKDTEGRYLLMNENCREMMGVDEDEVTQTTDRDVFPEEVAERLKETDRKVFEDGETAEFEEELPTSEGERALLTLKTPVFDDEGEPYAICGVSADITERREREKEIRRISEEYSTVFENVQDPMFLVDVKDGGEEFVISRLNPAYEENVGVTEDEACGKTPEEILGEEEGASITKRYRRCLEEGESVSYDEKLNVPAGEKTYRTSISPVKVEGEISQILGTSRDITERKEREEELERYEAFVQNSSDVIMHLDEEGTLLYQSPGTEQILKSEPETNVGRHIFEQVHPDDREYVMSKFTSLLSDPDKETAYAEFRAVRGDDESVWVEAVGTDQTDTEVGGVVVSLRNVSDRKEREEELERYEALVENTSDMVTLVNEYGTILYQSPSVERILGYDSDEAVGNNVFGFVDIADRGHIMDKFSRLLEEPDTSIEDAEYRFQHVDGSNVWLEASVADRRDTELGGFLIVSRDVTDRKERDEELRRTKERLDLAVEGAKLGVWDWDVEADEVEYNDRWAEMLGMSSEDSDYDMEFREENADPEDLPEVNRKLEQHVAGETERFEAEYRMRTAEGEQKWIRTVGQAVERGEDGRAKRVVGVHMDIDDQKQRERELKRYETFVEMSSDVITHVDEEGKIIYQNPSMEEVFGYEHGETVGDSVFEYAHPDDRELVVEEFYDIMNSPDRYTGELEFRVRKADGSYVWVEAVGTDHRETETGGFVVNIREITERKEREKELEKYEAFIENSSDVIMHLDEDGTMLYQSAGTERIFGHEPGLNLNDDVFEYIHPDDHDKVLEKFSNLIEDSENRADEVELRAEDEDGSYVWLEAAAVSQTDTEFGGVVVSIRDITKKKKREQELKRYEAFIQNSSDIITHLDEDGTILYQSPSAQRILRHEHGERVGDNAFDYVHPEDSERLLDEFMTLLEGPEDTIDGVEVRYERDDGTYVWLEVTGSDQRETEAGGVVVNSREITERKRYEEQLERSQGLLKGTEQIADTGGWEADIETGKIRWTAGMYEIFSMPDRYEPTVEESIGSYHPEDRGVIRRAFEHCQKDGEPFSEELRITLDEELLWVHVRGEPVRENGEITCIRGSVRDITEMKKRERELERSQDLLRMTERISDTGGLEVDVETGEQRWTEGTYRIHGVSDDYEPTAEEGLDFYHPDDRDVIKQVVERCIEEGEPFDEEIRLINANGELRWVRPRGEPVYEDGEVVRLRGAIRDITQRKEREMELLRNNKAVRELYEITADPDVSFEDKIEMVLESCRSRLGLPYAFVTDIDEGTETQTVTHARGTHELLQPGESCPLEQSYCRKTLEEDGLLTVRDAPNEGWEGDKAYEVFELGCYIGAKLTVGDEMYGTLCFADTEPRKKSFTDFERTLVELMANWVSYELERERSRERLRRQKERLDDFASVVSHDLRSPLAVLRGNLQLAEETEDAEHFESCRNAVDRMEEIIDDLLSLARDVDETGEIEPVGIADVVEECWQNIDTKNAQLTVEAEEAVMADRGKLRQMLENMLRNSVIHGGDDVTVTVSDLPEGNGFRVEDNGTGIPEKERNRVFDPGYTTEEGGTGLGMYIAKQVAETHGWEMEVVEAENEGAAFEITGVSRTER